MPIGLIHHFPSLTRLRRHAETQSLIANIHQLAERPTRYLPAIPRKLLLLSTHTRSFS